MVATPGRLNDFMETKTTTVRNVAYLVLDEAVSRLLLANGSSSRARRHANRFRFVSFGIFCASVHI
jgi:hypothetical protein